jgi:hypothetical protein
MWSGPRNISTAMMRAWGNRSDSFVCDEPLYAHYLAQTGFAHPGAAEVIEHHDTHWETVVDWLTGPIPEGKGVFYQKQMAHHLLDSVGRDWLGDLQHCFLIRPPREMLTSLLEFIPVPTVADTGLPQQWEIFSKLLEQGITPPVLDAPDVLRDPRGLLSELCQHVGVPFEEAMLSWPPGLRDTDGIWAKHWYAKVEKTTSFGEYRRKTEEPPAELADVLAECNKIYDRLYNYRLTNAAKI